MIYPKTYSRIVLIGNWIFDKLNLDLTIVYSPIARVRWQTKVINRNYEILLNGDTFSRLVSPRDLIPTQPMETASFSQRITPTFENSRLSDLATPETPARQTTFPLTNILIASKDVPNYILSKLIKK